MYRATPFVPKHPFYMREQHRSRELKSERPWGEPTCPPNPPSARASAVPETGATDLGKSRPCTRGTGIAGGACGALDAEPAPHHRGFMPSSSGFPLLRGRGVGPSSTVVAPPAGSRLGSRSVTIPIIPITPKVPAITYVSPIALSGLNHST
jgi:hypothetical protein